MECKCGAEMTWSISEAGQLGDWLPHVYQCTKCGLKFDTIDNEWWLPNGEKQKFEFTEAKPIIVMFTAGEDIKAGDLCYCDPRHGLLKVATPDMISSQK
jgi:hypothetical protein